MTEHVCEWVLRDNHAVCLARNEKGNRCYAVLLGPEIISRLNATERLSVKVARRNGVILRLNADKLSYGTQTQGYSDSVDLMDYANILEGKDE